MKSIVIRYGVIASVIMILMLLIPFYLTGGKFDMDLGEILGYVAIVAAMTMVFFGVKHYRDKTLGGKISFGNAFKIGTLISFVGSFIYGIFEAIFCELVDFNELYLNFYVEKLQASGQSQEIIDQQIKGLTEANAMWNNPIAIGVLMFLTVFIIGVIIALVSAAILRKHPETIIT